MDLKLPTKREIASLSVETGMLAIFEALGAKLPK
jgi:hypothetical protein